MEIKLVKLDKDKYTLIYKENNIMSEHVPVFDGKLSLKNCQAIENGYDLDELFESIPIGPTDENGKWKLRAGFITGFQKAVELFGDKKFNYGHLDKMFTCGKLYQDSKNEAYCFDNVLNKFQQTEWDVEIVMECCGKVYPQHCDGTCEHVKPLLDADGYLILKRKV